MVRLSRIGICLTMSLVALSAQSSGQVDSPQPVAGHFSVAGQRPTFHEDNIENIEVVVTSAASEGRMSLIESWWLPAFSVSSHYHKTHAETFYILAGRVEWTIGGQTHVMGAGDAVHIPANTVHSVKVVEKLRTLMIQQPGGYEAQAAAEVAFTPAERKEPKIQWLLAVLGDFNRVSGPRASPATAAGRPAKAVPVFSFRGKRGTFQEPNVENVELVLTAGQSEGRLSIIESDWLPGFTAPPHYHKTHAETFYVVSGQVEWTIGGVTRLIRAGDAVHIPPNTVHSVRVVGGRMHSLMLSEPGGFEENVAMAATYTDEERKDPRVQQRLRAIGDFQPPPK